MPISAGQRPSSRVSMPSAITTHPWLSQCHFFVSHVITLSLRKRRPCGRLFVCSRYRQASNPPRLSLLRIDLVLLDRPGHILPGHLPVLRQGGDGGMGDVVPVNFEEPP